MTNFFFKMLEECIYGSLAGVTMVTIGHPFDTLKTRRQISVFKYSTMIRSMIKNEGIFSFYKGFLSPFISLPIFKAVLFCSYKLSLEKLHKIDYFNNRNDLKIIIASCFGGFCNAFVAGPTELIKTKLQILQGKMGSKSSGNLIIIRDIYRKAGLRGFTQGLNCTIIRDMTAYPVQFLYFEKFLDFFSNNDRDNVTPLQRFLSGAISGVMCWTVCYPLDVIKSQIQSKNMKKKNKIFNDFEMYNKLKKTISKYGIRGLYSGMGIIYFRAFFAHGASFTVWDWLQKNVKIF